MFPVKKIAATITSVTDLSPSARSITLTPEAPFPFSAGSFVNVFIQAHGVTERRAFSISSTESLTHEFTISVRLNTKGSVSPVFWQPDIIGTKVEVMGPLGLNIASKMSGDRIFLFGFGVGAGVVKSVADHFISKPDTKAITIITGNRDATEILHKNYFDSVSTDPRVTVIYVVSQVTPGSSYPVGYIQDHISGLDFNNSLVYVCGQEIACSTLVDRVKATEATNCQFFIEAFH